MTDRTQSDPERRTGPAATSAADITALGPFFTFATHPGGRPPTGSWRPLAELTEDGGLQLADRVTAVRAHLAARTGRPPSAVEQRVAASVAHLGLTARLVSPLLALTALRGAPPGLALAHLLWQPAPGGLFPLSLPADVLDPAGPNDPTGAFLDGPVRQLTHAMAAFSLSPRVLWGNVASAIHGASAAATAASVPLTRGVRDAADTLLGDPLLHGSHTTRGQRFRRRSCCLLYRAAPDPRPTPAALCADCVLADRTA